MLLKRPHITLVDISPSLLIPRICMQGCSPRASTATSRASVMAVISFSDLMNQPFLHLQPV